MKLIETLVPPEDIIESIWLNLEPALQLNYSSNEFKKYWAVERSTKNQMPCYSAIFIGPERTFSTKDLVNNIDAPYVYRVEFRPLQSLNYTTLVYFHSNRVRANYLGSAYLEVETPARVTYDLIRSERLEWPYSTNCRHYDRYRKLTVLSQAACIDECLWIGGIEILNRTLTEVLIRKSHAAEQDFNDVPFYGDRRDDSNETFIKMVDWYEYCTSNLCSKPDCIHEEYVPNFRKPGAEDTVLSISVDPPKRPDIVIQFVPAINHIDFVTYVLSTIAFWTGFAPLGLHKKWFENRTGPSVASKDYRPKKRYQLLRGEIKRLDEVFHEIIEAMDLRITILESELKQMKRSDSSRSRRPSLNIPL